MSLQMFACTISKRSSHELSHRNVHCYQNPFARTIQRQLFERLVGAHIRSNVTTNHLKHAVEQTGGFHSFDLMHFGVTRNVNGEGTTFTIIVQSQKETTR